VVADLRYGQLDEILGGDLHAFLGGAQERCVEVSRAIQEQYSFR
jgi:hypothetical protein